ncbi:ATP-binding protein [Pedobacter sp. AW1-32]|uniref:ATP-binding protein n=1 Tax=Pedobacter sp. AW1-32 TaxID=3383026 RepID=UPI003FEFCE94
MENKVNINNNSVDFAGITKEYKEAVAELIWNGFDAGATEVDLIFDANEIDFIPSLTIKDNGSGINLSTLGKTFGAFLDSLKRSAEQRSSYIRGKKGKGRFSFIAFAQSAIWNTTYLDEVSGEYLTYDVTIHAATKDYYYDENKIVSKSKQTGTTLQLLNLFGVTAYSFSSEAFQDYLKYEFGWFLLLNSKKDFKLSINGEAIRYEEILADHQVSEREFEDASSSRFKFTVTFVRWKERIGDKFYYYFLDSDKKEVFKQLTSFNNNAINFNHSVYIESDYFNNFNAGDQETSEGLFGSNQQSPVFKMLIRALQKITSLKQKQYVRETAADELMQRLETSGLLPVFGLSTEQQQRKHHFMQVVREVYCIQPKLFKGLSDIQERTLLMLVDNMVDREPAERILSLFGQILNVNEEELETFKTVLTGTLPAGS